LEENSANATAAAMNATWGEKMIAFLASGQYVDEAELIWASRSPA